jgi:hypothetical protein
MLGYYAGNFAVSASYSVLIGYKAGYTPPDRSGERPVPQSIGPNNIIIGTNITLEKDRKDSINIGGIIFGTGSYSTITNKTTGSYSGSAGGKIGINQPFPTFNFEVSGSVGFPNLTNSTQTNVVSINTATGQLFYQPTGSGGGGSVTAASIGQINTGSSADVYVRPGELEQSKYATHNIFNFLNFT